MTSPNEKTILIVDDEPEIVDFLSMALEDEGFHVETASDGSEALQSIQNHKPDLISLDLVMPKYPGSWLYHQLKKNKEWSNIPVLIVTGHAHDEQGKADFDELSLLVGGNHLEKPIKSHDYVNAVRRLLHMEETEQASSEASSELRRKLAQLAEGADEESLKKALDLLKKNK
ncbi:MAG: response regulator [Candidatus Omnitrophica bacterium]|nr:response regulator [Candidatus Omnitrophota bacterium]